MKPSGEVAPGRLLIVDDESSLVTALLSTLRDEGFTAVGATTPSDALEHLQRERFDVVLTDLHLPEMDGIALLHAALEIDPKLSGILMTGHGTIDSAVDAMKAGAVDYILKPFKLKTVLAVLARAFANRRLRDENELLNQALAKRTQELEAVNKELEAFSYSVSHDLRAPLRAIEGFTQALLDEVQRGNRENLDDYGRRITRGVSRMNAMIDDLLRMARTVRSEILRSEVDLGELTREVVAKFQAQAPDRTLTLTVAADLLAMGDAGLLQVAMENLLGNAWKYTANREVARIEVGVQNEPHGKTFYVRDNGIGFDMAEADRLFAPFQRLRSSHQFEGTGIGLCTAQRIIQRHGGRIWAESLLGNGAAFFFTLPSTHS